MSKKKKTKIIRVRMFHEMDFTLTASALVLSLFGIVMAFSASYYYSLSQFGSPYRLVIKNLLWYAAGWIILLFITRFDYHVFRRLSIPAMCLGLLLLVAVIALRNTSFTLTINNATRWLKFGVSIMPGELIKPALIIFFAALYSADDNAMRNQKKIWLSIGLMAVICILIMLQPNLSTAVIVALLGIIMMIIAGLRLRGILAVTGIGVVAFCYLYFINDGYWHTRIITAFDPWADPLGNGYQVIQSLLALGSGGIFGKGLGQSIQKTLYLPEPQSDFILPIIGEEIGFVGIVAILILYAILIGRIVSVAIRAKDSFGAYIAGGTAALLSIHIILNIMVVTGTCPPTGVFLPFMSQGGNATLVFLALIGICLNISRQSAEVKKDDDI